MHGIRVALAAMNSHRRSLIILLLALVVTNAAPLDANALSPQEMLRLLKAGGYTLHFRHALTDFSKPDRDTSLGSSCGTQRNLSPEGRKQAADLGAAIRALNIPITEVRAGPLCRTADTARLMFGSGFTIDPDVRGGGPSERDYPGLRGLIATPVKSGGNVVLVGHGHQFATVAGAAGEIDEGDAAIVKGLGGGKFTIVGIVKAGDWRKMLSVTSERAH